MSAEQQQYEITLPSKKDMVDVMGRPLTQGLFLEVGYGESAIYTLKEDHHVLNGKEYPSLKKLYLQCADPTEYEFATTFLCGWKHWNRLCDNKTLRSHIDEWRFELEVKLRSQATKEVLAQSRSGSFQAAKWVADKGWSTRGAGRPSKEEQEREKNILKNINDDFEQDAIRLKIVS